MNNPCGCYYGGDCTKTTVCAVDSVREEFEDRIAALQARLDAVQEEVQRIDEAFSHPYTTSHEAYRNIRSIVDCLHKALVGGDDE